MKDKLFEKLINSHHCEYTTACFHTNALCPYPNGKCCIYCSHLFKDCGRDKGCDFPGHVEMILDPLEVFIMKGGNK